MKILVLLAKVSFSIFLIMLIRWTIPRFRFDQLMELTWKVFLPLSLANVVAVMWCCSLRCRPMVLLPISIVLFALFGFFTVTAKRMEISRRRRASLAMQ